MSELRFNPLTRRWVAIAAERRSRPGDFVSRQLAVEDDPHRACPFCPGNEEDTPPALETYGPHGSWLVRVVPNLYPAFSGEGRFVAEDDQGGFFRSAAGTGIHEVIVFSPDHKASWADLTDTQAGLVMAALRDRFEDHARVPGIGYTQAIVNHGREAGASLEHPHGQLLGIPFIPRDLSDEMAAFARHPGSALFSDLVDAEEASGGRLVASDDRVVAFCPYWSGSPYELLVVPRRQASRLDGAAPADVAATGRVLRDVLGRLRRLLDDVAYNLVFHSAPHHSDSPFCWHVHVLPNTTTAAGFEMGTGVRINVVPPEQAAAELRLA
ncbi:MAG: DUF4921 family protein [Acidimicrobiia bacterium]|nr:DUF4921 family protein [Acidimicrobiia bacterium]